MTGIVPPGDDFKRSGDRQSQHAWWRLVWLLGAASMACWAIPLARGHGPYGHGAYKVLYVYASLFGPLAWLASLCVALCPARHQRPVTIRLMALLAALLLALPICDLAAMLCSVRLGHIWYYSLCFPRSQNRPDPELIWQRKPLLHWCGRKTPECDQVVYRTDEHGFRNPAGIRQAEIVVVGDSVTEAGEVAEEATFVRKMAASLGVTAANLGTSGYGPQQELAVLERYGLSYRPRLVIWQFTEWNDLLDAQMYLMRDQPDAHTLPPFDALYARHSPVMQLVSALLPGRRPKSVAFRTSDGRLDHQAFWPYQPDIHKQWPQGLAATEQTIATAFEMCRRAGIEFVVLYVPSHVRVLLSEMRFRSQAQRDRFCPGGLTDRADDLAHAMAEFCERLGCPVIDMCPLLRARAAIDNQRIYIRNDPHLGIDGHDEAQKALVAFVERRRSLAIGSGSGKSSR